MKDSEVIREARELISAPEAWIKGAWCERDEGDEGIKMCAEGAIFMAMDLVHHDTLNWDGDIVTTNPQVKRIFAALQTTAKDIVPEAITYANTTHIPIGGDYLEVVLTKEGRWISTKTGEDITDTPDVQNHLELLPSVLSYRGGDSVPIHFYNDNEVTKHEDVLAIFDKTAAELEEKGE